MLLVPLSSEATLIFKLCRLTRRGLCHEQKGGLSAVVKSVLLGKQYPFPKNASSAVTSGLGSQ